MKAPGNNRDCEVHLQVKRNRHAREGMSVRHSNVLTYLLT